MSENQPAETTVKAALFVVLAIGLCTLYAAIMLDFGTSPRHCSRSALFTPCDQRVSR